MQVLTVRGQHTIHGEREREWEGIKKCSTERHSCERVQPTRKPRAFFCCNQPYILTTYYRERLHRGQATVGGLATSGVCVCVCVSYSLTSSSVVGVLVDNPFILSRSVVRGTCTVPSLPPILKGKVRISFFPFLYFLTGQGLYAVWSW